MTYSLPFSLKHRLTLLVQMVVCLIVLIAAVEGAVAATRMLMMNPMRAIFTDRQRVVNVSVSNPTTAPISYTISLVTMRKNQDGKLLVVEKETEEEKLIKSMIRFSPRRATIEPGKRQLVKLMTRKPKDLPPGEYQTRIRLTPLREGKAVTQSEQGTAPQSMVDIDIVVSSTFPIIIQHGGLESDLSPQSISFKNLPQAPSGIAADVLLARSGNCSAFGNVFLRYLPENKKKKPREIGRSQGLAVYLPDTEKMLTVPLNNITPDELKSGTIQVAFQPHNGVVTSQKRTAKLRIRNFALK